MKLTAVKLKTAVFIALVVWNINSFAQVKTVMYVMKNGEVVFQLPVSDIDNVTFDNAPSDSALIVQKNDDSFADKILLNNIQQLSFSDENLSIETLNGSETYAFENITKLLFGNMNNTGIGNPTKPSSFNVLVYLTQAGDVVVKSTAVIKSLTLFSIDGKMISMQHFNEVETQCIVPLQGKTAGVYLLHIETEQGVAVKKVVKLINK